MFLCPGVLEQMELQSGAEQVRLLVQVQGVRLHLQLKPEMVLMLAKKLGDKAKLKAVKSLKTSNSTLAPKARAERALKLKNSPKFLLRFGLW